MGMHWPGFFVRLGSAIVFSAIMLAGMMINAWTFWILLLVIQALCIREFFSLTQRMEALPAGRGSLPIAAQICGWLVMVLGFFYEPLRFPLLALVLTGSFMAGFLLPRLGGSLSSPLPLSFLYILLPMVCGLAIYDLDPKLPLMLVLLIWTNDTMAYICGSFFGKTPLSPISPRKTWEGTLGGGVMSLGLAALVGILWSPWPLIPLLGFAAVVIVSGTLGDLLESKMKRLAKVKDSGRMMPGHGGALDRFDSFLAALPPAYAYAFIWYWLS